MEILQDVHKNAISLFNNPTAINFFKSLKPHIEELNNYYFYFTNPVFDLIILVAFLFLSRSWGYKKAFSYCLLVSSMLYLITIINTHFGGTFAESEFIPADILRTIIIILIFVVSIYYLFIKDS